MKFHEYITQSLNTKFEWGKHDCVTWAISWGSILFNENLLEPYGTWTDRRSAMKAIKTIGGLSRAFNNSDKLVSIHPNFAMDGDLMLVGKSACLVSGEYVVGAGKNGLVFRDRTIGKEAWTYVK
jgi:hypothetical protein